MSGNNRRLEHDGPHLSSLKAVSGSSHLSPDFSYHLCTEDPMLHLLPCSVSCVKTSVISSGISHKHLSIFPDSLLHLLCFLSEQMKQFACPKMKPGCYLPFLLFSHSPQPPSPVTSTLLIFQISSLLSIPTAETLVYPTDVCCPDVYNSP